MGYLATDILVFMQWILCIELYKVYMWARQAEVLLYKQTPFFQIYQIHLFKKNLPTVFPNKHQKFN